MTSDVGRGLRASSRAVRVLVGGALGLAVTLSMRVACAEPVTVRDRAAARTIFNAGKKLLDAGKWAEACEKFDKSLALEPNVSTLIKIGRCRVREGRLATASEVYERALALNEETTEFQNRRQNLAQTIKAERDALSARIPSLTVTVIEAPPGLTVLRDGKRLPASVLGEPLPVDVGEHQLIVEAPGYRTEKRTLRIAEAQAEVVEFQLVAEPSEEAPEANPQEASGDQAPPRQPTRTTPNVAEHSGAAVMGTREVQRPSVSPTQRTLGLVIGGAGLLTLGVAGYFGVRTLSLVNESNPYCRNPGGTCSDQGVSLRDQARDAQMAGVVVGLVGGGLLATGLVLTLTAPRQADAVQVSIDVRPHAVVGRLVW
jgi:hypothetical protein